MGISTSVFFFFLHNTLGSVSTGYLVSWSSVAWIIFHLLGSDFRFYVILQMSQFDWTVFFSGYTSRQLPFSSSFTTSFPLLKPFFTVSHETQNVNASCIWLTLSFFALSNAQLPPFFSFSRKLAFDSVLHSGVWKLLVFAFFLSKETDSLMLYCKWTKNILEFFWYDNHT